LAEVDIEGDLSGAGRRQAIEQLPMQAPWPRPDTDFLKASGVDLDNNDVTAGRPFADAEPVGVKKAVKGDDEAAGNSNGKAGQDRERRLDPRHRRLSSGFGVRNVPFSGAGLSGRHGAGAVIPTQVM
jgi:hypothetical protein